MRSSFTNYKSGEVAGGSYLKHKVVVKWIFFIYIAYDVIFQITYNKPASDLLRLDCLFSSGTSDLFKSTLHHMLQLIT